MKTTVPSEARGQTEKKYGETLEYYLVAFFDVQGQRAKLRELRGLPRTRGEFAGAAEILKGTVGSVLNLRDYFQKYFDGFMESVNSMPAERRAKVKENVRYRGFSDSFVVSVALRNNDEQLTPAIGSYACLLAACGAMTSSLASRRPLRGGIDAGLGMLIAAGEVYGPVLERAYALESGAAEYCRIVIGDQLWGYLTLLEGQSFSHPHGCPRSVHEGTVSLSSARNRLVATLEQLPGLGLSNLIHIDGYGRHNPRHVWWRLIHGLFASLVNIWLGRKPSPLL